GGHRRKSHPRRGVDGGQPAHGTEQDSQLRIAGTEERMSLMNTAQLTLTEKFLDLATAPQSLLVSNIASVDTPGYRTQDMDFHAEMVRALSDDPGLPAAPVTR